MRTNCDSPTSLPSTPSLSGIWQEILEAAGIHLRKIFAIVKEYLTNMWNVLLTTWIRLQMNAICRKVHRFYLYNELTTIYKILRAVNEDGDFLTLRRITLRNILLKIDFRFKKRRYRDTYWLIKTILYAGEGMSYVKCKNFEDKIIRFTTQMNLGQMLTSLLGKCELITL